MAKKPTAQGEAEGRRRLLVVIDDTPLGQHTARIGLALAADMAGEAIFHIAIPVESVGAESAGELAEAMAEHHRKCSERTQPVFDTACANAKRAGVACDTVLTIDETPSDAVLRIAADRLCALVVAGSHGRGAMARLLSGSLVDELVRRASCPVVVCREEMGYGTVAALPESEQARSD
jgi:nucleotide-binding universal stress UspA family protein